MNTLGKDNASEIATVMQKISALDEQIKVLEEDVKHKAQDLNEVVKKYSKKEKLADLIYEKAGLYIKLAKLSKLQYPNSRLH